MNSGIRLALSSIAVGLALLALSGCGSSDSVVHFKGAPHASISQATLNHWMGSIVGSDFRTSIAKQGPTGLVSQPADYPRCINSAKLVAPRSMFNQLRLGRTQLSRICHELYQSIKAQALSFLIGAQWTKAEAAEERIAVTTADVAHEFAQSRAQRFPTEAYLHKYERERQLSLADLLYQAKLNLLVTKLLPHFQQQVKRAGGGEQAYAKLALANYKDLLARTNCEKRYVVPGCSEYHGPSGGPTAANVILTELAGK
jgi:hypothetical protein